MNGFVSNKKATNYTETVGNKLEIFKKLGANISIKLHYLHSHSDKFLENLGDSGDDLGEFFHQNIKSVEQRYQGRQNFHMITDYSWNLARVLLKVQHSK